MIRLLCAAVIFIPLTGGCAKRPVATQAFAPSPLPPVTSDPQDARTGPSQRPVAFPPVPPRALSPVPTRVRTKEFVRVIDLADIHFDFDAYGIRPSDRSILDANARWLQARSDHILLIEGHCDERGTTEYNLALGMLRGTAAMNYLVSRGIRSDRITVVSYGEERARCTEKTEACWAENRRAHFKVKPR